MFYLCCLFFLKTLMPRNLWGMIQDSPSRRKPPWPRLQVSISPGRSIVGSMRSMGYVSDMLDMFFSRKGCDVLWCIKICCWSISASSDVSMFCTTSASRDRFIHLGDTSFQIALSAAQSHIKKVRIEQRQQDLVLEVATESLATSVALIGKCTKYA